MTSTAPLPLTTPALRRSLLAPRTTVRRRTYYVYVREPGADRFVPDPGLPVIVCQASTLQVGTDVVTDPDFGRTSVTWHQQAGSASTSGVLFFADDGLTCHGSVTLGPATADAAPVEVFASAVPPTTYATRVTRQRQAAGTDPASLPADAWGEGPQVELGYRIDPGTSFPRTLVRMAGQDVSDLVALNVDSDDRLVLSVDAGGESTVICETAPGLPLAEALTFALDGESFAGVVTATCADPAGSGSYLVTGAATTSVAVPAPTAPRELEALAVAPAARSLAELLSLVPDASVGDQSNALLVQGMKWAIGQDGTGRGWLHDFWLQETPTLPQQRIDLVSTDLSWYQKQFSVAYLSYGLNGLTGPSAPATQLDADQAARLQDFLTRELATSMSYTRQKSGLYRQAYVDAKPRLTAYVADGATWAARLLAYAGSGPALSQMTNRIMATNDASAPGNITSLLTMLDPEGPSAGTYQERVLSNLLTKASLQTTVQDETWTMSWLPDLLEAFAEKFAPAAAPARAAMASVSADDSDDAASVASAVREAADYFGNFTELAKQLVGCLISAKGQPLVRQSEDAAEAFARAYPNHAKAARVLFVIAWAGGLFSVIMAFVDFRKLSDTQKAAAINQTISLVNDAVEAGLKLFKPKPTIDDWVELDTFVSEPTSLESVSTLSENLLGEEWVSVALDETTPLFNAGTREVAVAGTAWTKIFTTAEKVVAWIGVAVAAVATVLSFIDFVRDIRDGHVTQAVLDGVLTAANAAMTVSLVLGIVLESVAAMFVASVFAIVGLIITIIELFLPQPKEPTPADRFMSDYAVPFVDSLPVAVNR